MDECFRRAQSAVQQDQRFSGCRGFRSTGLRPFTGAQPVLTALVVQCWLSFPPSNFERGQRNRQVQYFGSSPNRVGKN